MSSINRVLNIKAPNPQTEGYFSADGDAKPVDGSKGFAPSCIFHDTKNAVAYINKGTVDSCSFKEITTAA